MVMCKKFGYKITIMSGFLNQCSKNLVKRESL